MDQKELLKMAARLEQQACDHVSINDNGGGRKTDLNRASAEYAADLFAIATAMRAKAERVWMGVD